MSESNDRPAGPPGDPTPGQPDTGPASQPNHQADNGSDPTEELKRNLEATRLPPDVKEQILAELPPPEERERMYREMMEKGGVSFEEFFEPLLAEFEEQL